MTERDRDEREQTTNGAAQRTGAEGEQHTARDQGDGFGQMRGRSGEMNRAAAGGTTGDDATRGRGSVTDRGGTGGYGAPSGYSSGSEALGAASAHEGGSEATGASAQREPRVREDAPIDEERFDTRTLGTREPPGEMPAGEQARRDDEPQERETE